MGLVQASDRDSQPKHWAKPRDLRGETHLAEPRQPRPGAEEALGGVDEARVEQHLCPAVGGRVIKCPSSCSERAQIYYYVHSCMIEHVPMEAGT